jgi:hypothetical protein
MIKRMIGFAGSYLLGLDPSKMPAWGVARTEDKADAAAEVAAAVVERCEETEDMAAAKRGRCRTRW